MSYKFDSLIIILNKLDSKETVTVKSLVSDLEVSERTVHRYLNTLEIAGFPIRFDRRKESYEFIEGYSLRRPSLSVEETLSFALAKNMMKGQGAGFELGLQGIEAKLASRGADLPGHIVLKSEGTPVEIQDLLEKMHDAITNHQRVRFVYDALYSSEATRREVDPYYLFFHEGFWYLRGNCHRSEGLRTFALDRILSVKVLNKYFVPTGLSSEVELSSSFGSWLDGESREVVLRFSSEVRNRVLRKKWHQSQKTSEQGDGRIEIRFLVRGMGGIKRWIYQWIPHVEVLEPEDLRGEIADELSAAQRLNRRVRASKG